MINMITIENKKLYLVTGGSGFLGQPLVKYILQQGGLVRVISRDEGKLIELKEKYPEKQIFVSSNEKSQDIFSGNTCIREAFIQTSKFSDPEFLKNNFYESYCLDAFSINNHHSILIK